MNKWQDLSKRVLREKPDTPALRPGFRTLRRIARYRRAGLKTGQGSPDRRTH